MKRYITKSIFIALIVIAVWGGAIAFHSLRNTWRGAVQSTKAAKTVLSAGNPNPVVVTITSENVPVQALTPDEQQMIDLVNQERTAGGLQPLKIDMRLVATARTKARDLIDNHYFDHQSATLGSPFDQMKSAGIQYGYAGENLAGSATVGEAHQALMKSPTHRDNILFAKFTHIGVGVIDGGKYGKMFVQHFIMK